MSGDPESPCPGCESRAAPAAAASPPPTAALRASVLAAAERLEQSGCADRAHELREALESWDREHGGWTGDLARQLGVHHDINNALVGVRGNVQLLLMGPAAQIPGVRDRLEVVLRESDRIRDAAVRLHSLKMALTARAHESGFTLPSRAA